MKHSEGLSLPKRMKVLLCESDAAFADDLRRDLESLGHHVTVVRNQVEAIEAACRRDANVVILDADGIGLEPLYELWRACGEDRIVRLVLCALFDERTVREMYRVGANWVLPRDCRLIERWPFTSEIDSLPGSW